MATVKIGGREYNVEVRGDKVVVDGHEYDIKVREEPAHATVTAGGVAYRVQLPPAGARDTSMMAVHVDYRPFTVEIDGRLTSGPAPRERKAAGAAAGGATAATVKGGVTAQIAGRVLSVKVKVGDTVAKGDLLLLLEAMKMENEIKAPGGGVVKEIPVSEGARVSEGQVLVVIE